MTKIKLIAIVAGIAFVLSIGVGMVISNQQAQTNHLKISETETGRNIELNLEEHIVTKDKPASP